MVVPRLRHTLSQDLCQPVLLVTGLLRIGHLSRPLRLIREVASGALLDVSIRGLWTHKPTLVHRLDLRMS